MYCKVHVLHFSLLVLISKYPFFY